MRITRYCLLLLIAVICCPLVAAGQGQGYTNVTGSKFCYANGSVNASFVNQSGAPQLPLLNGSVFPTTGTTNMDSNGNFSFFLADNNQVFPLPSQWSITACAKPGGQPFCGNTVVPVTGPTKDITSFLNPLPCPPNSGASGSNLQMLVNANGAVQGSLVMTDPTHKDLTAPGISTGYQLGGLIQCDQQPGWPDVATMLNNCNAALVAQGGGIMDARMPQVFGTGTPTSPTPMSTTVTIGAPAGTTAVTLLLPTYGMWGWNLNGPTPVCGIQQHGDTSIIGQGPPAGGSRMWLTTGTGPLNMNAIVCSDNNAIYIRDQGFEVRNQAATGPPLLWGALHIPALFDGSSLRDVNVTNAYGNAGLIDSICCGAQLFSDQFYSSTTTGGIPLILGLGYTLFNATFTSGSATVCSATGGSMTNAYVGDNLSSPTAGSGIPSLATVQSVTSGSCLVMSAPATANSTGIMVEMLPTNFGAPPLAGVSISNIAFNQPLNGTPGILLTKSATQSVVLDTLYTEDVSTALVANISIGSNNRMALRNFTNNTASLANKPLVATYSVRGVNISGLNCVGSQSLAIQDNSVSPTKNYNCDSQGRVPMYDSGGFASPLLLATGQNLIPDSEWLTSAWTQAAGVTVTGGAGNFNNNALVYNLPSGGTLTGVSSSPQTITLYNGATYSFSMLINGAAATTGTSTNARIRTSVSGTTICELSPAAAGATGQVYSQQCIMPGSIGSGSAQYVATVQWSGTIPATGGSVIVSSPMLCSGSTQCTYQSSSAANLPVATNSQLGVVQPDATSILINGAGVISTAVQKQTASLTPVAIAASTCAEQTFTITGLVAGKFASVTAPSALSHVGIAGARISATNTLAINFCGDATGGTPPAGSWVLVTY